VAKFWGLFQRGNIEPQTPAKPRAKYAALTALIGAGAVAVLVPEVQRWEGYREVPYKDIVGIATVCWGDTKNVQGPQTRAQCEERLERQLIAHAKPVVECVPGLTRKPNATAAAVSLAYNIGTAGFCRSTVARRFNQGRWREGCDAMLLWNKAGGRVVRGLVNRRNAERKICLRDL
jgi:lysozyme